MEAITILMPTYNKELYIDQAICSVLIQKTQYKFKLIVIDDKSTDNSLMIAKQYQKKYPNIISIIEKEKNEGCLSTIIKGYENTNTDYFCVLDPDDYWINKSVIENAISYLEQHNDYTMYVSNTYCDQDGKLMPYFDYEQEMDFDFDSLSEMKWGHTSGTIFRNVIFKSGVPKALYHQVGGRYEASFRGDSFRNIIHLQKGKAHFVTEMTSVYRIIPCGIWTRHSQFQRNVLNADFFLRMFHYFDKIKPEYFIIACWRFCKSNLELIYGHSDNSFNIQDENVFLTRFNEVLWECLRYLDLSTGHTIK